MIDISYDSYRKSTDIHGSILYPGIMVAPAQRAILMKVLNESSVDSILDPFCGSGTALYEAAKIDPQIFITGIDINPLATLITRSKLNGVTSSESISRILNRFKRILEKTEPDTFSFPGIDKWYRTDIADMLRVLRKLIMTVKSPQNRRYLWVIFADTVHRYSNTRSSTFKLHAKSSDTINHMPNDVFDYFFSHAQQYAPYYESIHPKHNIITGDSIEKTRALADQSIDITITSPPYGDNQTTITYGQFSSLALRWIPKDELTMEGWEIDNYSIIDRKSLGGTREPRDIHWNNSDIESCIEKIHESKRSKVVNFMDDYYQVLCQVNRITKKKMILTLGDRTVDGVKVPLVKVTQSFLDDHGFHMEDSLTRSLHSKRIPSKTSKVRGSSVHSMTQETVLIYSR